MGGGEGRKVLSRFFLCKPFTKFLTSLNVHCGSAQGNEQSVWTCSPQSSRGTSSGTAAGLGMGRLFIQFLPNGTGRVYACKSCGCHLASSDDLLSKVRHGFSGNLVGHTAGSRKCC